MLINKIRLLVQAFSFLILTYGGRIGINLGYALPCFACPYMLQAGGYCFLMFFYKELESSVLQLMTESLPILDCKIYYGF